VLAFTAGDAGAVSRTVVALAEGVLKAMIAAKLKVGAMLLVVLGTLGAGLGVAAHHVFAAKQLEASPSAKPQQVAERPQQPRPEADKPALSDRFGDPLPPRVLARLGTVRLRHGGQIYQIAFSPRGQTLASTGRDGVLRLWDAATGKELHRFGNSDHPAHYFAFSPEGSFLVSASSGHQDIYLWDVGTGRELRSFKNPGYWFHRVAVSPDSKTIAAAGGGHRIALWDTSSGRLLRTLDGKDNSDMPPALAFSPDSKTLATAKSDLTVPLWDVATGRELRRFSVPLKPEEKNHANPNHPIWDLAFSPDGKVLACCGTFHDIWLWDAVTGQEIRRLSGGPYGTWRLVFSPVGKMLTGSSDPGKLRF